MKGNKGWFTVPSPFGPPDLPRQFRSILISARLACNPRIKCQWTDKSPGAAEGVPGPSPGLDNLLPVPTEAPRVRFWVNVRVQRNPLILALCWTSLDPIGVGCDRASLFRRPQRLSSSALPRARWGLRNCPDGKDLQIIGLADAAAPCRLHSRPYWRRADGALKQPEISPRFNGEEHSLTALSKGH